MVWSGATTLEKMAQIIRDGHRAHRAHVGAAGVAHRNPDAREERRRNDTNTLAENFSPVSHDDAVFEHEPMHANVPDREALTEDVSSLQMLKRPRVVAAPGRFGGAKDFGVDSLVQRVIHAKSLEQA